MSNIFIVKKSQPKKLKPTGKVVKFQFRKPKVKPLKLRFGSRNAFRDIL